MLKKTIFITFLSAISSVVSAGTILLSQNFDSDFQPGLLKKTSEFPGGSCLTRDDSESMQIVSGGKSSPNALCVNRKGKVGFTVLRANTAVPAGNNFQVAFDIKIPAGNYAAVFIGGNNPIGAVNIGGSARICGFDENKKWTQSGMKAVPADQWINIKVNFNALSGIYDITAVYPDGSVQTSIKEFPYLQRKNISEIQFLNTLPIGSSYLIDNVVLKDLGKPLAPEISDGTVLLQNFDQDFYPGELQSGSGRVTGGKWKLDADAGNYFIVTEPANSKPHSLKVSRNGKNGYFSLRPSANIPKNRNFTIDFALFTNPDSGTVLHLATDKGKIAGGAIFQSEVRAYNAGMKWENCNLEMPVLPTREWIKIKIKVDVNLAHYTVSVTFPDGTVHEGTTAHPLLDKDPVTELRFVNILPQKSFVFIDDVKISYEDKISISGRDNHAPDATSRNTTFEKMLKGQDSYPVSGNRVELELSPPAAIDALLFSGSKLPGKVTIDALNAGGHWINIGNDLPIDQQTGLLEFNCVDQVVKLAFQFKDFNGAVLTSLGVFSPIRTPQSELDAEWSKKIDAEYDLPVYDRQYEGCSKAILSFINHTDSTLPVKISMHERLKNKPFRSFALDLPVGSSDYTFDLDKMPNGEYLTVITDGSGRNGGKITRLLRHCTSPENTAVPRREMTGEKMYFPDTFFLSDCRDIRFTTGTATPYPVKLGTTNNDEWVTLGTGMGLNDQGNVVINFKTTNRLWQSASSRNYHAVGSFDDLTNWQIHEGNTPITHGQNIFSGNTPEAAQPDWDKKPGPDGKIKYRFYDPAADGPIQLNQLRCEYITEAAPGTVEYHDYDWTVMRPSPAHVWTVWYKSPGEALIVGKRSLISGFLTRGNLEQPNSGSDLRFGQWLSDDGKTLFFGFGRHLARYMPYRAEYDNLTDRARIIGIWRTTDGINWEQNFAAPPDKSKPIADQHYGGKDIRLPNGAGLHIAILCRYSASTQQISWEIIYSWDGFRWTRFQREEQFLNNGSFGSWYHGGGYISESALEHNGKTYQLMFWINDHYHFQSEIVHGSTNSVDHITADYMKKRYGVRHLEKWPYFRQYFNGSWEKLAEHTRNAKSSVGIMEYRYDGFFFAAAGDQEARMLTRPVTASGALAMNARIHDGGFIKISLLDAKGNKIENYSREFNSGDDTNWQIFDSLPQGEFQVELTLKKADIYTLIF